MASASLPKTMRAWIRTRRGLPSDTILKLVDYFPVPAAPTGPSTDVLVRVTHVPLQYGNLLLMRDAPGLPTWLGGSGSNFVPEIELAGVVVAAGGGVPAALREPGTRIIAAQSIGSVALGHGVLAEYVRVPSKLVVQLDVDGGGDPAAVDVAAASGLFSGGATALTMVRKAGLQQGHKVLINGASGSVGTMLIQLCKLRGAHVVGVASGPNEALVRELGADDFVDYRANNPLPAYLAEHYGGTPFDFVFDCVGSQELFVQSPAYLKPEGALINIGAIDAVDGHLLTLLKNGLSNMYCPAWLGGVPRRYVMFSTTLLVDDIQYIAHLYRQGQLRVIVDSVLPMEDVVQGYARVASKRARGKVVIHVG